MPLPDPQPVIVQAPKSAGIGLRFNFARLAAPSWPVDWWQRNYDTMLLDPDEPGPLPLTSRQMRLPPPPP
jgi:hypothetical protein